MNQRPPSIRPLSVETPPARKIRKACCCCCSIGRKNEKRKRKTKLQLHNERTNERMASTASRSDPSLSLSLSQFHFHSLPGPGCANPPSPRNAAGDGRWQLGRKGGKNGKGGRRKRVICWHSYMQKFRKFISSWMWRSPSYAAGIKLLRMYTHSLRRRKPPVRQTTVVAAGAPLNNLLQSPSVVTHMRPICVVAGLSPLYDM